MIQISMVNLEGRLYKMGYKVVTSDLKSLGLRNNPNIIQYQIDKWYALPENKIVYGKQDFGGIWVATTLSNAKKLSKYIKQKYAKETRIFKATIDKILYFNSYRIKTNAVALFEEI